ncbi:MAG: pyridoxamine 5'-phosphate oxidase family protein [Anaerolineae bacterium]|nr:pyridoxamine 5'-phosphate oxidase family protein [Anaerolineae bacterium]
MSNLEKIRSRPDIVGYGIPQSDKGMLTWDWVLERVASPQNYWVSTVTPDGHPHSIPVWGVWVDEIFYHGGGAHTRRGKNLAHNPYMVMHLESGSEVVIIEGESEILTEENIDPELAERIDAHYQQKYHMKHGLPVWRLIPHKAFAWQEYPTSVTRWIFKQQP